MAPGARPNQNYLPQPRQLPNPSNQPGPSQAPIRTSPIPVQNSSNDKEKGILGPNPRSRSQTQCFRCQKFGHIASQCNAKTYLMTELEVGTQETECVEEVYEPNIEDFVEDFGDEQTGLEFIQSEPQNEPTDRNDQNPRLHVVRYTLAQTKTEQDWRRTSIFYTFLKINDKTCKILFDSGSCINAIASGVVSRLGLKSTPHPNPYKVAWVDKTSISVSERCLVPIQFLSYKDEIWCDCLPMDVGQVILGRPWLYDRDVTLHGRSNSCSFMFQGRKIVLNSLPPREPASTKKSATLRKDKSLHIITSNEVMKDIDSQSPVFNLVARVINVESNPEHPPAVVSLLEEFHSVFSQDLPDILPPMRDLQHVIDLIPGASVPTLLHHRLNPNDHTELKCKVDKLLTRGYIHESLSPCAIPTLRTPNKITVKYRFPIPRLNDLLDFMSSAMIPWQDVSLDFV